MANVFVRLIEAYKRHGYLVRTGLNPLYFGDSDMPFTVLFDSNRTQVSVGGGLALQELHFLDCLLADGCRPTRALVIGNAFGWSALALGMLMPQARVVAMDAGLEGTATDRGAELTRAIAIDERLDVRVVDGLSPRDLPALLQAEFTVPQLDFVLIDGLHTNDQLTRDFVGALPYASPDCVFLMHDVVHWHMLEAFGTLPIGPGRERRILTRCPSGMGVVFPKTLAGSARDAIEAFCDPIVELADWQRRQGATDADPGPVLTSRLARGWPLRRLSAATALDFEGQAERAVAEVERAIADNWGNARTLFQIASRELARPRLENGAVVRCLERAVSLRPAFAVALHLLGVLQLRAADAVAAVASLERAVAAEPLHATWHYDLGRVYAELGRDAEAIDRLAHAASQTIEWAAPWHLLGVVQARHVGPAAALAALERADRLETDAATVPFDLGRVQCALGDVIAAEASFEKAVARRPEWGPAHYYLGLVRQKTTGDTSALPSFSRAVTLDPADTNALQTLGLAAYRLNDHALAMDSLLRVVAADPERVTAQHVLGLATMKAKGGLSALPILERAVELAPGNGHVWFDLGVACMTASNDAAAAAAFEKAGSLLPEWLPAKQYLTATRKRLAEHVAYCTPKAS